MNTADTINVQTGQFGPSPARTADPGPVPTLLRSEAMLELAAAVWAYRHFGGTWPIFALLFLVPDVSMAGYLANPRTGARWYNFGHTYVIPALLGLTGFILAVPMCCLLALIWAAHIAFDRLLGYGLKYPSGFSATHLCGSEK